MELSFKSIVNGRTKTDHKSSPCHYMTGELKRMSIKAPLEPMAQMS